MRRQLLFCVESNKKAHTDTVYINSTINRFYTNDRKVVYRPIFLESKTKYNDKGKVREIKDRIKGFPGETKVIYFIDVDDYDVSHATKELFDSIEKYCDDNDYELVYFCRDIEDVYWGDSISKDEKVKKAESFNRNKLIDSEKEEKLKVKSKKRHCSNILVVLDKYLERKS